MRRLFVFALSLLLAAPAGALILDSGDGQGNTTPPSDDPGWAHVGKVTYPSGIYLGNGWMLTASHVTVSNPVIDGVTYPVVPGTVVQLHNPDTSLADLQVFRIDPHPNLPLLRIRSQTPALDTDVTFIAVGLSRGAATTWGADGYLWGSQSAKRWGTNKTAGSVNIGTLTFTTIFTKIGSQGFTDQEAQGADGDSGGAAFIKNGANWELAGVLLAVSTFVNQPEASSIYGNFTYVADLSQYRAQLISLTRPKCANEIDDDGDSLVDWPLDPGCASQLDDSERPDQDQDGVDDPFDNCLLDPNPDQYDSNLDGYGNLCDTDFDNDGGTGLTDYGIFKPAFGKQLGNPAYNPDADAEGDGGIGLIDFGLFKLSFGSPPGPSGLACAGTIPCTAP